MPHDPAAQQIATTLGGTVLVPLLHIPRIVESLGPDRALQVLAQAMTLEARGGQLVPDGSRRRLPAGVCFRLVRDQTTLAERSHIWPWTRKPQPGRPSRQDTRRNPSITRRRGNWVGWVPRGRSA